MLSYLQSESSKLDPFHTTQDTLETTEAEAKQTACALEAPTTLRMEVMEVKHIISIKTKE